MTEFADNTDKAAEEAALLRKVKWKCRRGMRELDRMMERYLEMRWGDAPTEERDDFLHLLDAEDDKLFQWMMGYEVCTDERYRIAIDRIRVLPPSL